MSARELYWSYRRGWLDGSRSPSSAARVKDTGFTEHATRPDLTQAYLAGWNDGELATSEAMSAACTRYGHDPSPLRSEDGDDITPRERGP